MPECLSLQASVNVSFMPNKQASKLFYYATCVHLPCIFMSFTSSPEQPQVVVGCCDADARCGLPLLTVCACLRPVTQHVSVGLFGLTTTAQQRQHEPRAPDTFCSLSDSLSACLSNWLTPMFFSAWTCLLFSPSLFPTLSLISELLVSCSLRS